MAEIVNLRLARKRAARAAAEAEAAEQRARFGRSKAQTLEETARREREARHLDGHKRDDER